MTMGGWLSWLRVESFARPSRLVLMAICVVASVAIAALVIHAMAWLRFEVRPEVERMFPRQRIIVEPAGMDIVFLRLQAGNLNDEVVGRLRRLEGVDAVYPQMAAEFPAMIEVSLPGMSGPFTSEVAIFGVSESMIAAELPPGASFRAPAQGAPIPVVASAFFLDVYNMGIAEANRLPKITERAAIGREFDFILGATTIGDGGRGRISTVRARVVGLTRNTSLAGLVVPVDVLAEWNRTHSSGYQPRYIRVMVDSESPDAALRLNEEISAMGLHTMMAVEDLKRYSQTIAAAELALGGVLLAILALAAVGVVSTVTMSARERRASWGIQRAMGMRPATLVMLVTGEGVLIAGICAAIASLICAGVASLVRDQFGETIDGLAFLPGDPLALGIAAYGGIVVLCGLLVILPLMLAALAAARKEPIDLLAERSL